MEAGSATAGDIQGFTIAGADIADRCVGTLLGFKFFTLSRWRLGRLAPRNVLFVTLPSGEFRHASFYPNHLGSAFFAFFAPGSRGFGMPTCCHVGAPGV